jgi:hypothetical protein
MENISKEIKITSDQIYSTMETIMHEMKKQETLEVFNNIFQ